MQKSGGLMSYRGLTWRLSSAVLNDLPDGLRRTACDGILWGVVLGGFAGWGCGFGADGAGAVAMPGFEVEQSEDFGGGHAE